MIRKRLFAVALTSRSADSTAWVHARMILAVTEDEAKRIATAMVEPTGKKVELVTSAEVSDDDLRAAYDGLFLEKGGWR